MDTGNANEQRASTSRVQMIAAGQIASQAKLCAANLQAVRSKIDNINGDVGHIAQALGELKETVTELTLEVKTRFAEMNAEVRSSNQRWNIWPTLKDILIVAVSLTSLGLTVYALFNK